MELSQMCDLNEVRMLNAKRYEDMVIKQPSRITVYNTVAKLRFKSYKESPDMAKLIHLFSNNSNIQYLPEILLDIISEDVLFNLNICKDMYYPITYTYVRDRSSSNRKVYQGPIFIQLYPESSTGISFLAKVRAWVNKWWNPNSSVIVILDDSKDTHYSSIYKLKEQTTRPNECIFVYKGNTLKISPYQNEVLI